MIETKHTNLIDDGIRQDQNILSERRQVFGSILDGGRTLDVLGRALEDALEADGTNWARHCFGVFRILWWKGKMEKVEGLKDMERLRGRFYSFSIPTAVLPNRMRERRKLER